VTVLTVGAVANQDIEDAGALGVRDLELASRTRVFGLRRHLTTQQKRNHAKTTQSTRRSFVFADAVRHGHPPQGRVLGSVVLSEDLRRKLMGVGERGPDFHALRHTFTDMMEGVEVPVPTIQLLIGHSRRVTMGTAAYATIARKLQGLQPD